MIKVAICDDDIQFIYKLEQSIFRFAEMKRIKVMLTVIQVEQNLFKNCSKAKGMICYFWILN